MELFSWAQNRTRITQGIMLKYNHYFQLEKNAIIDLNIVKDGYSALTKIDNLLSVVNEGDRVYLWRTFSLGDTLMLIPVVRKLKEIGLKPYIRTEAEYTQLLTLLDIEAHDVSWPTNDVGVIFDYVVERDHDHPQLQKMHRVLTYANGVGLRNEHFWDWNCNLENFPEVNVPEKYIVFQGIGNSSWRGLTSDTIQRLITAFELSDIKVIYIGTHVPLKVNGTILLYQKASLTELFSLIAKARCVISMDSSPLWVSHFTKTPVIAILGPSRKEERLLLHPLWPDAAIAIELNKLINCQSCFEKMDACKQKCDCLHNITPKILFEKLYSEVKKFYED